MVGSVLAAGFGKLSTKASGLAWRGSRTPSRACWVISTLTAVGPPSAHIEAALIAQVRHCEPFGGAGGGIVNLRAERAVAASVQDGDGARAGPGDREVGVRVQVEVPDRHADRAAAHRVVHPGHERAIPP